MIGFSLLIFVHLSTGLLKLFLFCLYRVRIEILRAVATKISVPERTAFCVANTSRPYLSVGPPGKGRREAFRFTEALEAFGENLVESDLNKAYERAGLNFSGIFCVLCARISLGYLYSF